MKKLNLSVHSLKILEFIKNYSKDNLNVTIISKEFKANYGNILKVINNLEKLRLIKKQRLFNNNRIVIKFCQPRLN
jgi:DNA-binding MarR family transcriptional regulator